MENQNTRSSTWMTPIVEGEEGLKLIGEIVLFNSHFANVLTQSFPFVKKIVFVSALLGSRQLDVYTFFKKKLLESLICLWCTLSNRRRKTLVVVQVNFNYRQYSQRAKYIIIS